MNEEGEEKVQRTRVETRATLQRPVASGATTSLDDFNTSSSSRSLGSARDEQRTKNSSD